MMTASVVEKLGAPLKNGHQTTALLRLWMSKNSRNTLRSFRKITAKPIINLLVLGICVALEH